MKSTCLLSLAAMLIWITGCSTTAPKASTAQKSDVKFAKEIEARVTEDQKFVMDGEKYELADIPAQLAKRNCDQYITIIVLQQSKMQRETLVKLVEVLVQNKYYVAIDPKSKYADVPIPPRS